MKVGLRRWPLRQEHGTLIIDKAYACSRETLYVRGSNERATYDVSHGAQQDHCARGLTLIERGHNSCTDGELGIFYECVWVCVRVDLRERLSITMEARCNKNDNLSYHPPVLPMLLACIAEIETFLQMVKIYKQFAQFQSIGYIYILRICSINDWLYIILILRRWTHPFLG